MPNVEVPTQLMLGSRFRALQVPLSPATIPYDSGNVRSAELPKTYLTKDIAIRLTGALVVTVAVTLNSEAPLGLLQKIALMGDGNEQLWAISGRDAYRLMQFSHGKAGALVAPTLGVGTNPFNAFILISAEAVNMAVPVDSYLDAREFEKTELQITWGAVSEIVATGTATISATTQVECFVNQSTEGLESIGFRRFIQFDERVLTGSQTDFTMLVPRSGLLAHTMFRTDRDKIAVNDIINNITLTSDSSHDHIKRRTWANLQDENVVRYQLDGGVVADGGRILGYAFCDYLEDGRMSAAINAEALNELKYVLDVTLGGGTTRIIRATHVFYKALRRPA